MDIKTYRKAEEIMKDKRSLNDLSLLLHYHDATILTITNNTGISKTFAGKSFLGMLDKFVTIEMERLEHEFEKL